MSEAEDERNDDSIVADQSRHLGSMLLVLSAAIKGGDIQRTKELWSEICRDGNESSEMLSQCVSLAAHNKSRSIPEKVRRDILEFFLNLGANVESPDPKDRRWAYKPLHMTTIENDLALTRFLLERGATVDSRDAEENTPLHWAATYGYTGLCELLLDSNADPNAIQQQGFTPLHDAACLGQIEVTKVLLERGANPNIADKEGWTPVHTASCYGHSEVLVELVNAGADLDRKNDNSEMPVHLAAINEHLGCLSALTTRGADLSQQDNKGLTPFFVAVVLGRLEVMHFLLVVGADTTTPNFQQLTPLKYAMRLGDMDAVRLMLKAGYDLHQESWLLNLNSSSSLMRQYEGNEEMKELLMEVIEMFRNPCSLLNLALARVRCLLGRHVHANVDALPLPQSVKAKVLLSS